MLGQPNYGAQGTVVDISPEQKGRITLSFTESQASLLLDLAYFLNSLTQPYKGGANNFVTTGTYTISDVIY